MVREGRWGAREREREDGSDKKVRLLFCYHDKECPFDDRESKARDSSSSASNGYGQAAEGSK